MPHSYAQNNVHLVFSTKDRLKAIPKNMQDRLWSYIAAICQTNKIFVHAVGGMEDHCHVLFQLPPTISLAEAILLIKVEMDGQEIRLAKRIWRLQRECVKYSGGGAIHQEPGAASSQDEF